MKDEKFELHGGGNSIRSFVYSNDVAMALLRVVEAGVLGETYHISTNQTISIRNLVGKVLSKIGRDFDSHVNIVNERIGKDSAYLLDSEKIRSDLNWIEQTTLDEGIENVISWVQKDWEELRRLPLEYVHER
jgi:dTDP-glucose 4,6-dehydratase